MIVRYFRGVVNALQLKTPLNFLMFNYDTPHNPQAQAQAQALELRTSQQNREMEALIKETNNKHPNRYKNKIYSQK